MRQQSNFLRQATLWLLLPVFSPLPVQASQSTNQQVSQPAEVTKGQLEQLHIRNIILRAEVQGATSAPAGGKPSRCRYRRPFLPGAIVGETSLPGQPARTVPANNRPVVLEINGRDQNSAPHYNYHQDSHWLYRRGAVFRPGEHCQEYYACRCHTQRWHSACFRRLTMNAITAESLLLFDDGEKKEILIDTNQRGDPVYRPR